MQFVGGVEIFVTTQLLKFILHNFTALNNCPGGEIGRRTVFRSQRSQGCAGSNPVLGTSPQHEVSGVFNL